MDTPDIWGAMKRWFSQYTDGRYAEAYAEHKDREYYHAIYTTPGRISAVDFHSKFAAPHRKINPIWDEMAEGVSRFNNGALYMRPSGRTQRCEIRYSMRVGTRLIFAARIYEQGELSGRIIEDYAEYFAVQVKRPEVLDF